LKKSLKKCYIDVFWLPKDMYQVLSMWGISCSFSLDTRIKNSQKGGGNLDEANASHTENGLY